MVAEASITWREVSNLGEPEANTYMITLLVTDVRKRDALNLQDDISNLVTEHYPDLGDVVITTAHLKGSIFNRPHDAPE